MTLRAVGGNRGKGIRQAAKGRLQEVHGDDDAAGMGA
jgi:hypothetical protein